MKASEINLSKKDKFYLFTEKIKKQLHGTQTIIAFQTLSLYLKTYHLITKRCAATDSPLVIFTRYNPEATSFKAMR